MSRETPMRGQAQASNRARTYQYNRDGRQTKGMMGDHIVRKGSGCEVWKPSWKGTTTTLRVFPAVCPENPAVWDPWRFSSEGDDYGDWLRTYPAVRNFGDPGVSFILFDSTDQGYDPQTNPAWVLYNAVNQAINAGVADPKWVPMTKGSVGRVAQPLPRPGDITLIQAAIMQHNNKDYDPPKGGAVNDATCVIELPSSAAGAMLDAMNERNPEFHGDPDDFANLYVHGDPVAIDQGAYVNFFQMGQDPRERLQANVQRRGANFGAARASERGGQRSDEPIGYGCFLTPDYRGMSPDLSGVEDLIKRKARRWDDVIQILSHEDQIRLISGAFPADMIIYAFENMYRDMIPEATWKQYRAKLHTTGGAPAESRAAPPVTGGRRGWGGQAPDVPPADEGHPDDGDGQPDGSGEAQPEQAAPEAAPAARRGFGGPAASGTPVSGQRRGFGGQAPVDGETVVSATAPTEELPAQPAPRSGFDARPAAATPPNQAAEAVTDAIKASKARVEQRGRNRPAGGTQGGTGG